MTDASPTHACDRCGHASTRADWLALHVGREHAATLSETQRDAFAAAVAQEEQWLTGMRRHVRGGLYVLPMALFYFFFLLASAQYGVLQWAVLPAPGIVVFGVLAYWMAYTKDQAPVRA